MRDIPKVMKEQNAMKSERIQLPVIIFTLQAKNHWTMSARTDFVAMEQSVLIK